MPARTVSSCSCRYRRVNWYVSSRCSLTLSTVWPSGNFSRGTMVTCTTGSMAGCGGAQQHGHRCDHMQQFKTHTQVPGMPLRRTCADQFAVACACSHSLQSCTCPVVPYNRSPMHAIFPQRLTWRVATSAVAASCTASRRRRLSLYGFRSGPRRSQSSAWHAQESVCSAFSCALGMRRVRTYTLIACTSCGMWVTVQGSRYVERRGVTSRQSFAV